MKIRYQLKPRSQRRTAPFRPRSVLPFGQLRTDHMFLVEHQGGKWIDPRIVPYGPLSLAPGAVALHYSQEIFEGAKAFLHPDGEIRAFRIDRNAARMNRSAAGVCMPAIPEADQVQAILALLDVERLWCPDQEGASLYIRPFMFATQDSLGVKPSDRYLYCVFLSPSGPYYPAGFTEPVKLLVTRRFHRAAPGGTGAFKTGGNYAASLMAGEVAHQRGAAQVLYLDVTDQYVEEAGSMNHFHVTRDGAMIIPSFTDTVLRSVTSESVIALGREALGLAVRQERVLLEPFLAGLRDGSVAEAGGLGTAAVVSAVGAYVFDDGTEVVVGDGRIGPSTRRVYETLSGIQRGQRAAPEGWLFTVPRMERAAAAHPLRSAARRLSARSPARRRRGARSRR